MAGRWRYAGIPRTTPPHRCWLACETPNVKVLHLLSYHLVTGPAEPVMNLVAAQRAAGHDARLACDTVREGDLIGVAEEAGIPDSSTSNRPAT